MITMEYVGTVKTVKREGFEQFQPVIYILTKEEGKTISCSEHTTLALHWSQERAHHRLVYELMRHKKESEK